MTISFLLANSKMPGLNFDAPPGVRDLEYLFDKVFSDEQRTRLQLLMGQYRDAGPQYGIVDQQNPNSAVATANRPLTVQTNGGNPLTMDILPGIAVTRTGNVIVVPEQVFGVDLANAAVITNSSGASTGLQGTENVVLLEYLVVDDAETNTVTEFNTVEAVRRKVAPDVDATLPQVGDPDLNKPQMLKVVTVQDFQDLTKFTQQRLNEVVVLGIVKVVPNPDAATLATQPTILSIDMTNAVNTFVRPWFSAVDQQHRMMVGTGSDLVPHKLSYNDLGGGALTLYQQILQHGMIVSRDLNVPGHPGKLCQEFVDGTPGVRVLTDTAGTVTGTVNRRYVYLNSYPTRIIGVRGNKLESGDSVPDTSVTAPSMAAELIPNTNILALWRQGSVDEPFNSTLGFTVYYTDSDCLRPPALPHDIMLVAGDIIQFQNPTASEEYTTGGKIYETIPTTRYAVGLNGPIPKNYRLMLDGSQQFVQSPQIVSCARLINDSTGVGTAIQTPQFPMYGPARIRVALWNAPLSVPTNMEVQVELTGKDAAGLVVVETLIFHGTAGSAAPRQVAWEQTTITNGEAVNAMQVSNAVFSTLDTWKIKPSPVAAGANALVQLWADVGPTVTPALDDALPICAFTWNGQSVSRIRDIRPIGREVRDIKPVHDEHHAEMAALLALAGSYPFAVESFKDPIWQDNILSRRDRHSATLNTVFADETLVGFNATDGTHAGQEWYYSRAFPVGTPFTTLYMLVFGAHTFGLYSTFGTDALIQYQVSTTGAPGVFSVWATVTTLRPHLYSVAGMSGKFSIRFRIAGKQLAGFALALA